MKQKTGALFDLDGVLLDSEGIYSNFWDAVEAKYPTHIPNFSSVIKGSNLFEILHDHYPNDDIRHLVTEMLNNFQRDMPFRFFDGALEFVRHLQSSGIPTCLVTSSDNAKMEALYRQHPDFKSHFDGIITGDMVIGKGKTSKIEVHDMSKTVISLRGSCESQTVSRSEIIDHREHI